MISITIVWLLGHAAPMRPTSVSCLYTVMSPCVRASSHISAPEQQLVGGRTYRHLEAEATIAKRLPSSASIGQQGERQNTPRHVLVVLHAAEIRNLSQSTVLLRTSRWLCDNREHHLVE